MTKHKPNILTAGTSTPTPDLAQLQAQIKDM
jgi:hypothetical protein